MTNINLTSPVFYAGGIAGVSSVVGYESLRNRVVRYRLTAPETGLSSLTLAFSGNTMGNGMAPELRFYIGTDPDSHADAGDGSEYTGQLRRSADGVTYTGSASLLLLPGEERYLWVFPATTAFGWMAWATSPGCAVAACYGGALSVAEPGEGELGQPMTLNITRYADFAHTLTLTLGSEKLTLCENSTEEHITWTPPLDLASQITTAAHGAATLTLTTLQNGTVLGSTTAALTLSVPESLVPTVSATWRDSTGAKDKLGLCVKLVSRLQVEATAAGVYGSTIVKVEPALNGKAYSGGVLTEAGEAQLTVTATDSRGRRAVWQETLTVADYAVPAVTLTASRCDADGTPNDMGEFAALTMSGSVTALEGNTAALTFGYGAEQETLEAEPGSYLLERIIPADSTRTLSLWAQVRDALLTSPKATMVLSIGYATLDLLAGGKGIAFGTTARREGFECAMDATFGGRVTGIPTPTEDSDAVPKSYADRAKDYVTGVTHNDAGYDVRIWQGGGKMFTAPRGFFNADNPDVLAWAKAMMQSGFDGVAHFQLGYQAAAPTTYCMGLLIANGNDRAEVIVFGATAFYHNQNLGGTWSGWRKITTTAV